MFFRRNWRTAVAAIALVSFTLSGVRPALAWATPPPPGMLPPTVAAPPAAGLCTTPVGVMLCAGAGLLFGWGALSEADKWGLFDNEIDDLLQADFAGMYYDSGTGEWRFCGGLDGQVSCGIGASGGGASWEDYEGPMIEDPVDYDAILEALYGSATEPENPPKGSENFIGWSDADGLAMVLNNVEADAPVLAEVGYRFVVGRVTHVEDLRGVKFEVWMESDGLYEPCPTFVPPDQEWWDEAIDKYMPSWVSCAGVSIIGGRQAAYQSGIWQSHGQVQCSLGGTPVYTGSAGGTYTYAQAMCPPGEVVTSLSYAGATNPNPSNNWHFPLSLCFPGSGGLSNRTSNNCQSGAMRPPIGARLTIIDEVVPTKQMVVEFVCMGPGGAMRTEVVHGLEVPVQLGYAPMPAPPCTQGEIPVEWGVESCITDSTTCNEVGGGTVPVEELTENELDCYQRLASDDPCVMWLEVWDGEEWDYCDPAALNCDGWWSETDKEAKYRCGWGGDYYTASQCVALKDFYDEESDGDSQTVVPTPTPEPDPTTTGDPVQVGGPQNPVSMQPSQNWFRRLVNEWWTGTTPSMQNACWPQGWGLLNPIQWVMRPTICALTFSFVPTTNLEVRLDRMKTEFETRTGISPDIVAEVAAPSVGGGCGWGIGGTEGLFFDWPTIDIVLCPEEYGVQGAASLSKGLGYGVLGFWAIGTVMRWLAMRSAPDETGEQLTLF